MGGKSISHRASQHKQRQKMRYMSMKDHMEAAAAQERNPLDNNERVCPHCGFKARYPFVRCPSCEKVKE